MHSVMGWCKYGYINSNSGFLDIHSHRGSSSRFGSAEPFDPELTTEGLTAEGLVAGRPRSSTSVV